MLPKMDPVTLPDPTDGLVWLIVNWNVVPVIPVTAHEAVGQLTENCPRSIPLGDRTFPPPAVNEMVHPLPPVHTLATHDAPVNAPAVVNVTICAAAGRAPM